ncbi:serine/threonine-protein kinase [Nonomuraea sp. ATR24]|uniref:serine/threonine-protein kinase n=1 Tax=Nonomuraea sp. ATR24 TaxID=1676744 RepID=UPI0035C1ABF4
MYGDGQWGVPGYTEVRELGSGAAGRVVLARRDRDDAEVAIKYLSDELRSDVSFVARFRHEARLLGTLRSPHNARLIDYVETGRGAAIVMELVDGVSLRQLLRSEGPTGPEAALTVLKGSLQGLAAAHAIGVVHRDYKPENVIVQGGGDTKLVDFGIAVMAGEGASAAGTPPYMAPEQWSGLPASPATDVYAATVVFFECLTGARPFRASNVAALAHQHQAAAPPVEEVPAALRELVERGLAKRAEARPASAEAFLAELEAVAAGAYGDDWEERGRRRLSALAGLLLLLFPSAPDAPVEVHTTLARTRFGRPGKVMTKLTGKIAIGAVCTGAVITAALVLTNALDGDRTLTAQSTEVTPSPSAPAEPATPEPPFSEPPFSEPPASEPPASEPPATELPDTGPPVAPTTAPTTATAAPPPDPAPTTAAPTRTAKPATAAPTATKTRSPKPTKTADPQLTGRAHAHNGTAGPLPKPTPTPTATQATTRPPRPTPTRTPTSQSPTPDEEPTGDGETTPGLPGPEPSTAAAAPAALLAAGLVTTGALPVTLAVKRRMAGRHRRKR